jgi:assimilatory nitrate reductase catalytic subunit
MSRTGTLGRLFGHVPEPVVQMHPQDMARRQLGRRPGARHLQARLHRAAGAGQRRVGLSQAFIAMHWGEEYLSGCSSTGERLAGVNALTTSAYCPTRSSPS